MNSDSNNVDLKTLSLLTLILVPLISSTIFFTIKQVESRVEPFEYKLLYGGMFDLISFVFGSIFVGILATVQLQLKRKVFGEEGFIVRTSPSASIVFSSYSSLCYPFMPQYKLIKAKEKRQKN